MKQAIFIFLIIVGISSTAAPSHADLTQFHGTIDQFRAELKLELEKNYAVSCANSKGENPGIWAPGFNHRFHTIVTCESEILQVSAVAKLLMADPTEKNNHGFDEITVRSIQIYTQIFY